jgi:hypothetical protein
MRINLTGVVACVAMRILQLLPTDLINRRIFGVTLRVWLPLALLVLLVGGLFSPLFDLSQIHGFSARIYSQHFYFDFIAGLGGYWASTFCQHWYHRIPLFIAIDALTTLALVTIVG